VSHVFPFRAGPMPEHQSIIDAIRPGHAIGSGGQVSGWSPTRRKAALRPAASAAVYEWRVMRSEQRIPRQLSTSRLGDDRRNPRLRSGPVSLMWIVFGMRLTQYSSCRRAIKYPLMIPTDAIGPMLPVRSSASASCQVKMIGRPSRRLRWTRCRAGRGRPQCRPRRARRFLTIHSRDLYDRLP
jgi:hypothetical protein